MPDKSTQPRLDITKVSPGLYKAMAGLQNYVDASGLERKLLDLIKVRASQINGCAYCIVMHTNDAPSEQFHAYSYPGCASGLRLG